MFVESDQRRWETSRHHSVSLLLLTSFVKVETDFVI